MFGTRRPWAPLVFAALRDGRAAPGKEPGIQGRCPHHEDFSLFLSRRRPDACRYARRCTGRRGYGRAPGPARESGPVDVGPDRAAPVRESPTQGTGAQVPGGRGVPLPGGAARSAPAGFGDPGPDARTLDTGKAGPAAAPQRCLRSGRGGRCAGRAAPARHDRSVGSPAVHRSAARSHCRGADAAARRCTCGN